MSPGGTLYEAVYSILWWVQFATATYLAWRILCKRNPYAALIVFLTGLVLMFTVLAKPYHLLDDPVKPFLQLFAGVNSATFMLALVCTAIILERRVPSEPQPPSLRYVWSLTLSVIVALLLFIAVTLAFGCTAFLINSYLLFSS